LRLIGEHPLTSQASGWLSATALVWSLVIAVRALSIAHGIGNPRAFAILILTALIFLLVLPFVLAAVSSLVLGFLLKSVI
jgi:hypothetical protein